MSTGMRKWMEKDCPDTPSLPAEVSIGREELRQLRDELAQYKNERDALQAKISDLMINVAFLDNLKKSYEELIEELQNEYDRLRAKIEAMEQQEPVAWMSSRNGFIVKDNKNHDYNLPLYLAPGAQPAPSTPEGWLRAIDEALVVAHIGVANESDTYEQANVKLNNLICFHEDIATDPAVNGGYKLVPIEPTETFYKCFSAYDGTSYSNPFDYDDFVKDWREALAAAPEAKP